MKFGILIETNEPEKAWNGVRFAVASLKKGHEVKIFLMSAGVEIESIVHEKYNAKAQIDDFVKATKIHPDVINVDVEGAEMLVMKGATRTLLEDRPLVWLSVHPDLMLRDFGVEHVEELFEFMHSVGYGREYLGTDFQRLYALGIDAFRIGRELIGQNARFEVDGVTGWLRVDLSVANRRVERTAVLAEIRNGNAVAIGR